MTIKSLHILRSLYVQHSIRLRHTLIFRKDLALRERELILRKKDGLALSPRDSVYNRRDV